MLFTPYTFLFSLVYLQLLILIIMAPNFMTLWLLSELLTLVFVGISFTQFMNSYSNLLIYFLIQVFSSFNLFMFYLFPYSILFTASLMLKFSVFPFYNWFLNSVYRFPNFVFWLSSTLHKLPFFYSLIVFSLPLNVEIFISASVLTTLLMGLSAFSVTDTRLMLVMSSISNNSWMAFSSFTNIDVFFVFYGLYTLSMFTMLLSFLSSTIVKDSIMTYLNLVNLSGLPPFFLFFSKMLIIFSVIPLSHSFMTSMLFLFLGISIPMMASYIAHALSLMLNKKSSVGDMSLCQVSLMKTLVCKTKITLCTWLKWPLLVFIIVSWVLQSLLILLSVAFFTLFERKVMGLFHNRIGPNKVSFIGLIQPLLDAFKLLTKQSLTPLHSNKITYGLSPQLALLIALFTWVSMPSVYYMLTVNFSFLMFFVISSLTVFSTLLSGWASNSKYSLVGSLRSVAQSISYESVFSTLLVLFALFIFSFSLRSFSEMSSILFLTFFIIWFVTSIAELHRAPFDFSESESELVSGFNTEYSGAYFAFLFLSEYAILLFSSLMMSFIFFGWLIPFTVTSYCLFTMLITFLFIWVRITFCRFRYDLLMMASWKILLPFTLFLFMVILPSLIL